MKYIDLSSLIKPYQFSSKPIHKQSYQLAHSIAVNITETPLKHQHQLFVANYIKTENATKAALAAGYSEKSAATQGSRLLKRLDISGALQAHELKIAKKRSITAENILRELGNIAFFDVRDLYREDGSLKAISELPDHVARAVSSIDNDGFKGKKVRTHSKMEALQLLAKHLNIINSEQESSKVSIIVLPAPVGALAAPSQSLDSMTTSELTAGSQPLLLKPEW